MSKDEERKQRLAEQLRANLKRRKAQAKARGAAKDGKASQPRRDTGDAGGGEAEGS